MTSSPDEPTAPHEPTTPGEPTAPGEPSTPHGTAAGHEPAPTIHDGRLLGVDGLRPVSPSLVPARYLAAIPGYVIALALAVGAVVLAAITSWWWIAAVAVVPLAVIVQSLLLTPRRVRAIGYLDGEQELVIARGIMFRTISTVPYGRVQSVTIDEGPIERRYGLATLKLTTGASGEAPSLPGLPRDEAERLRGLLAERGVDRMAAL
ncbi:PH domain-containing protein [Brachybacterium sp. NBEC-018]|uniref:PH domain-containing protein n=1 Tax=Brachybacterium sp. NBEC-018 TaxID=2996004 RepID=UPI002174DFF4|nr:PH domain-containing protein [Brachybacterium sp. NBEC-018]UVY83262.1 PH domain-containing protein [Brachybacterium sp. NBEC-018]